MAVVAVLGPTLVEGEPLSPLQSRIVSALVALRGEGATVSTLTGLAWNGDAPRTARASLQNQVAALRRRLGEASVPWGNDRYRLASTIRTDVDELYDDIARVDEARSRGDAEEVLAVASNALERFRGDPFSDLGEVTGSALQTLTRVAALRVRLEEARADALTATGRTEQAAAVWRRLVGEEPLHEGRWAGLITALDADGRRADALDVYREARAVLRDELGLAPGAVLDAAHEAVLHGRRDRMGSVETDLLPRPAVHDAVLDAAAAHQIVVVTGPAGGGKSTLLQQLDDPRPDGRTIHIDCGSSPWTALEPLRELLEAVGADPIAQWTTPAGDLPGQVAATIAAAAEERPLLVTVDHAAAGGPTTWRALTTAAAATSRLHLVLASRTGEPLPDAVGDATTVEVPPLTPDEVRRLTELVLRRPGRVDVLAAWLAEHTGGNPLFVRELVLDLRHRGQLVPSDDGGLRPPTRTPTPERLQSIVAQRLDVLGLRARRTCDVLAVVAPLPDEALLGDLDVTPADVAALRDARMLGPGPGVAFAHEALQEVARELTPPGRRIEIALVAANGLAQRGADPARVARMRLEAAEVDRYGAAAACRDAARAAAAEQAFGEAVAWSDRGLAVLEGDGDPHDPLHVELAVTGAEAARLGGQPGHAARLLTAAEQALDSSGPDLRRRATLALLRLGECCQPGHAQQRAAAIGRRALEQETDPDHAARLRASLSLTCSMVDAAATRTYIDEALARLAAHDDDGLAADVLPYTYMSLAQPEDLDARAHAAGRLAGAAARLGDPAAAYEADHLAFSVALARGTRAELAAAHRRMESARHVVADVGRRWSLYYQRATLAQLDLDLEEAAALAMAARDVGATVAAGRAWATWAAQQLELHRLADTLHELVTTIAPLVEAPGALPAWRAAAALVLAHDDPARARRLLPETVDELLAATPDFSTAAALQTAGRAAARVGADDVARRLLPRLRPWVELWSWQGTTTYGPFGDVVADLGRMVDDDDAVASGTVGATAARERMAARHYP